LNAVLERSNSSGKLSLADLIILGGSAAVEQDQLEQGCSGATRSE